MHYKLSIIVLIITISCKSNISSHNIYSDIIPKLNRLSKSDSLKYHFEDSIRFNMDKGSLLNRYQSLILYYSPDGCTCANWVIPNKNIYNREEIYLEPANHSLVDADTLYNGNNIPIKILVIGKFYSKKGYPHNYFPAKGNPDPARVFQYTSINVIKRGK